MSSPVLRSFAITGACFNDRQNRDCVIIDQTAAMTHHVLYPLIAQLISGETDSQATEKDRENLRKRVRDSIKKNNGLNPKQIYACFRASLDLTCETQLLEIKQNLTQLQTKYDALEKRRADIDLELTDPVQFQINQITAKLTKATKALQTFEAAIKTGQAQWAKDYADIKKIVAELNRKLMSLEGTKAKEEETDKEEGTGIEAQPSQEIDITLLDRQDDRTPLQKELDETLKQMEEIHDRYGKMHQKFTKEIAAFETLDTWIRGITKTTGSEGLLFLNSPLSPRRTLDERKDKSK